jgi:hypothetical protein
MAHADALVACNLVPASRQVALRVDGRSRDALLTCLWAALGRQTNEKRPPDAGRRWKVSSRQGPFHAPVTQLSGHAGSDVVGQLEMAPRSPGSPVPSLLSDVNLGAGFFDGALWAHFGRTLIRGGSHRGTDATSGSGGKSAGQHGAFGAPGVSEDSFFAHLLLLFGVVMRLVGVRHGRPRWPLWCL